jgi:hypothetical protein
MLSEHLAETVELGFRVLVPFSCAHAGIEGDAHRRSLPQRKGAPAMELGHAWATGSGNRVRSAAGLHADLRPTPADWTLASITDPYCGGRVGIRGAARQRYP